MEIGQRVRINTEKATIRFIGEVDGYGKQQWVGLEWDDPSRGKHDGVVKGKRYFQTNHPTGGSLMKAEIIPKPKDLLFEIKNRYAEDEMVENEIELAQSSKKIELIGMERLAAKQSNIEKLINIVLDNQSVGYPPPSGSPQFMICRELNLYGNLLYKWKTVRQILNFFPRIQELNLRRNMMQPFNQEDDSEQDEEDSAYSESCKKLVISECQLDENSIDPILRRFPLTTEVVAFGNRLRRFSVSDIVANRLISLDLEDNLFGSIDLIEGNFPHLMHLSLARCGITSLIGLDGCVKFPNLEYLNIQGNEIIDWKSVNAMRSLKTLKRLLFDCKKLEVEKGIHAYEVVIAKLISLIDLNRFDVSEVERRSAEIRFLNKYAGVADKSDHEEDITRLITVHGEPSVDTAKKGLSVVKIRIECGNRVETRKLPLAMSVQKIRDMLARLFKVPHSATIRLYLVMTDKTKQHRIELENPLREFGHYSPSEDRDILVVEHN
uniref:Tubulin-specific chaperone E n=1 Tax=Caenorhabditis tropicalis TaxID=1561998 RepID=A0A1I7UB38_9PELO